MSPNNCRSVHLTPQVHLYHTPERVQRASYISAPNKHHQIPGIRRLFPSISTITPPFCRECKTTFSPPPQIFQLPQCSAQNPRGGHYSHHHHHHHHYLPLPLSLPKAPQRRPTASPGLPSVQKPLSDTRPPTCTYLPTPSCFDLFPFNRLLPYPEANPRQFYRSRWHNREKKNPGSDPPSSASWTVTLALGNSRVEESLWRGHTNLLADTGIA